MAQVDALRFLAHVAQLFAPDILDGQTFIAYIGKDNSFTVQADNIIKAQGGTNTGDEKIEELYGRISDIKSQADSLEAFCKNIPALQSQIQSLSGSNEAAAEFYYSYLYNELSKLSAEISGLDSRMTAIEDEWFEKADAFYDYNIS
ncbi:MAG: hypothetical protein IJG39_10210 [Synergistaceae bacterium]|nr:hypothetical protein [Synergistaceae bacterium]